MKFNELKKEHSLYEHIINDDLIAVQQYFRVKPKLASKVSLEGYQLIHVAAASGALSVIEWLLENQHLVPSQDLVSIYDEDNNTPLVHAIIHGQLTTSQLLVDKGASLTATGFAKHNAVFLTACINNRFEILQWCIGAIQNKYGEQFDEIFSQQLFMAAIMASYKGHIKIVEYLILLKPSIVIDDINGDSLLFCAACEGHEDLTRDLIAQGAILTKTNHLNETPLEATLKLNQRTTAKVILMAMIKNNLVLPDQMRNARSQQLLDELKKSVTPSKTAVMPSEKESPAECMAKVGHWSSSSGSNSPNNSSVSAAPLTFST